MTAFTNYHTRYGYPRWVAVLAEFWWRMEHAYARHWDTPIGRLFAPIRTLGYRQRKRWEDIGISIKEREERFRKITRGERTR